jgi:sugar lactone lactonase YvrE
MAEPTVLLTGLVVGESPRWHDGRLWFSNWGAGEIVAMTPEGDSEVMVRVPTTIPFCFDWRPDGTLLIVSGPEAKILCQEPDGALATYADLGGLAKGWNEIVVDRRGNAYVNGSDFDFAGGGPFVPGVIALVTPAGAVRQVADGIGFGNGMAVTPDNKTLIVAESFASRLTAFDIAPDGSLTNRRVWAQLTDMPPDGICLDEEGALWAASMARCVRLREGGEVLSEVAVAPGLFSFACALGGAERRTLYIMAADWYGPERMGELFSARTGRVLAAPVTVPGVARQ